MNDLTSLGALLAASGGGNIQNSPVFGIKGKKQKRMDPMQILGMLDKFMGGAAKGYQQGQGGAQDAAAGQNLKSMMQGGWSPQMGGGQGGMGGPQGGMPPMGGAQGGVGGTPRGGMGAPPSQIAPMLGGGQAGMVPGAQPTRQMSQSGGLPFMAQNPQSQAMGMGGRAPMGGGPGMPSMAGGMGGQPGGGNSLALLQQLMQGRGGGGQSGATPGAGGQGASPFQGAAPPDQGAANSAPPGPMAEAGAVPSDRQHVHAEIDQGGGGGLKSIIDHAARAAGIDPRVMYGIVAGESAHGNRYDIGDSGQSFGPFQMYKGGGLGNRFQQQTGQDVRNPSTVPAQAAWIARNIAGGNTSLANWHGYHGNRDWNPRWGSMGVGGSSGRDMPGPTTGRTSVGMGGSSGREMGGPPQASGEPGAGPGGTTRGMTDPRIENPSLPGSAQEGFYSQAAHRLLQVNPNISGKQFLSTMKAAVPFLKLDESSLNHEHAQEMSELKAQQKQELDQQKQELAQERQGETERSHRTAEALKQADESRKAMETTIKQQDEQRKQLETGQKITASQAKVEQARAILEFHKSELAFKQQREGNLQEARGLRGEQANQRLKQAGLKTALGQIDKQISAAQRAVSALPGQETLSDEDKARAGALQQQVQELLTQREQLTKGAGEGEQPAPSVRRGTRQGYGGSEGQNAEDKPPMEGARKAPDGKWYVKKGEQYFEVRP